MIPVLTAVEMRAVDAAAPDDMKCDAIDTAFDHEVREKIDELDVRGELILFEYRQRRS